MNPKTTNKFIFRKLKDIHFQLKRVSCLLILGLCSKKTKGNIDYSRSSVFLFVVRHRGRSAFE